MELEKGRSGRWHRGNCKNRELCRRFYAEKESIPRQRMSTCIYMTKVVLILFILLKDCVPGLGTIDHNHPKEKEHC